MTVLERINLIKERASSQYNFNSMIESMRRKVEKGLIEGVSVEEFELALSEATSDEQPRNDTADMLEKLKDMPDPDQDDLQEGLYLQEIYETQDALDKYGYLMYEEVINYLDELDNEEALSESIESDAKFASKMDPEEYVAQKAMLRTPASIIRYALNKTNDIDNKVTKEALDIVRYNPELSSIIKEIQDEAEKQPLDKAKIKELFKKFKEEFKSSSTIKDAKNNVRVEVAREKQDANKIKNNLYEQSLQEFLGGTNE